MAGGPLFYDVAREKFGEGLLAWSSTVIKLVLLSPDYVPDLGHATVDLLSVYELNTTNYTPGYGGAGRKTLTTRPVTTLASHATVFPADPATWPLIGPSVGGPVLGYVAGVVEEGGSDSTSYPVFLCDGGLPDTLDGTDLTYSFPASGVMQFATTQFLGALQTGLLKNETGTGNLSIATSADLLPLPDHDHSGTAGQGGNIPETSITDGAILARVASAEQISAPWEFSALPTFDDGYKIKETGFGNVVTVAPTVLTANRAHTVPDKSGTYAMTSDIPTSATYITQTPSSALSAEQALSALGTGIMKSTTGTGVVSIATGSDLPTGIPQASVTNLTTDLAGKLPVCVAHIKLTGQTAAIPITVLASSPTPGIYMMVSYLECTAASSGAVSCQFTYTDDIGTLTTSTAAYQLSLTSIGRTSYPQLLTTGRLFMEVASGDVSYTTNMPGATGGEVYSLRMALLRIV